MFEDSEFGEDEIGRVSKVAGPGKLKWLYVRGEAPIRSVLKNLFDLNRI